MNEYKKISRFKDLIVWKQGHELVLEIYKLASLFPKSEVYSLTDQIKRAGVSITSNIAEGFGRWSYKEKVQFYYIAKGSLTEVENQIEIAKDVGYINEGQYFSISEKILSVSKLLNRLIFASKESSR